MIVANLDTAADTPGAVQGATLVFATAAVPCDLAPALGVSWSANGLFVAPEAWRRAAADMRPGLPPMTELIRPLRYAKEVGGKQARGLVTRGLAPFVGHEVDPRQRANRRTPSTSGR